MDIAQVLCVNDSGQVLLATNKSGSYEGQITGLWTEVTPHIVFHIAKNNVK